MVSQLRVWRPGWEARPFKLSLKADCILKAEPPAPACAVDPSLLSGGVCQERGPPGWQLAAHTRESCTPARWHLAGWPRGANAKHLPDTQPGDPALLVVFKAVVSRKPTSEPTSPLWCSDSWCCRAAFSREKGEDGSESGAREACVLPQPFAACHWQANGLIFEHKVLSSAVCFVPHLLSETNKKKSELPFLFFRFLVYIRSYLSFLHCV